MGRVKLRFNFRHAFKVSQIYRVIIGKRVSEIKPKFYEDPMEILVNHIHQDKIYFNIFRYKYNFHFECELQVKIWHTAHM